MKLSPGEVEFLWTRMRYIVHERK